jgi:hypothetical protein
MARFAGALWLLNDFSGATPGTTVGMIRFADTVMGMLPDRLADR